MTKCKDHVSFVAQGSVAERVGETQAMGVTDHLEVLRGMSVLQKVHSSIQCIKHWFERI